MNSHGLLLGSARYRRITTMEELFGRYDRLWTEKYGPQYWKVIPQHYQNIHPSAGEFVLIRRIDVHSPWTAVCSLHSRRGAQGLEILSGREAGGADWMLTRDLPPHTNLRKWRLLRRGASRLYGTKDNYLDGPTTGSRLERLLEANIVSLDLDYELHPEMPSRPDVILPRRRIGIFAHGCRQHGHSCERALSFGRGLSADERRNMQRHDAAACQRLTNNGWRVLTVWECAVTHPGFNGLQFLLRLKSALDAHDRSIVIAGPA